MLGLVLRFLNLVVVLVLDLLARERYHPVGRLGLLCFEGAKRDASPTLHNVKFQRSCRCCTICEQDLYPKIRDRHLPGKIPAGIPDWVSMVGNDQHGNPISSENVFRESFRTKMRVSVPPHETGTTSRKGTPRYAKE